MNDALSQTAKQVPSDEEEAALSRQVPARVKSLLAQGLLLTGAAAGVFLAGGPRQGSLGIFLVAAGFAMVVFRPTVRVNVVIWVAAGALVACSLLAFLPAAWFVQPEWRHKLSHSPVIALALTVTPAPRDTAFWTVVLTLSVCVGLFSMSHPVRSRWLIGLAAAGSAICAAYGALAIYSQLSGWQYPFDGGPTFGFFPNRNHTATLLVTGVLLGLGVVAVAYHRKHWVAGGVGTASTAVCAGTLMLFSESRGGVVFAVIGVVLWAVGLGRVHRSNTLLLYFGAFLLVALGVLVFSGSQVRDRLWSTVHSSGSSAERGSAITAPEDARLIIFKDAFEIVRNFPWTGSGLGTFPLIFPQYEKATLSEFTSIHPESDWLMLADEGGVPAVACGILLLAALVHYAVKARSHPYWPLRWGCIVAAAAAVLHGTVDVPIHRVALGWWIVVVGALGLQRNRSESNEGGAAQWAFFVAAGLCSLTLGTLLIRAEWFGGAPVGPFLGPSATEKAHRAYWANKYGEGYEIASDAFEVSPMNAALYYEAGASLMAYEHTEEQVDQLFKAQRLLSPNWPEIPRRQAEAWCRKDGSRAERMWSEALNRKQKIAAANGEGEQVVVDLYREILSDTATRPDLQELLMAECARGADFALAAVEAAAPVVARKQIAREMADERFLAGLSLRNKARFAALVKAQIEPGAAEKFMTEHRDLFPVSSAGR